MKKSINPEAMARFEQRLKAKEHRGPDLMQNPYVQDIAAMMPDLRKDIAAELVTRCNKLREKRDYSLFPGDLVEWKEGLFNHPNLPPSAEVAIVTRVIEKIDPLDGLDIVVGLIVPNPRVQGQMDFIEIPVDSRRLELYVADKGAATDAKD